MRSLIIFGLPLAVLARWPDFRAEQVDNFLWQASTPMSFSGACFPRGNTTIPAQWLRLAYHDMSTHNVDDGTGGLDGSIVYELDRPQNIGSGMGGSAGELATFGTSTHVSFPDAIALGAVLGVASCGGPNIPFRAGRVGATSAGPPTVPEPHQDLSSHTESFRRQGFSQSEMIGMVACGHSLGGVRRDDFPTILPPAQANETDLAEFDGTKAFDNVVVTGYLQNTTPNPLVVGHNMTTNSDMRIFSSDGNATMQSISSPESFTKTCVNLFERMLNTVPAGVQLSDVIDPIKYKVGNTNLIPGSVEGELRFITSLRLHHVNKPNRRVTLFWKDGEATSSMTASTLETQYASFAANRMGLEKYTWFKFDVKLNSTSAISKFWFQVDEGDGSAIVSVDNNGEGLPIDQNGLLFDVSRSSRHFQVEGIYNEIVLALSTQSTYLSFHDTFFNGHVKIKPTDPNAKVNFSVFVSGDLANPHGSRKTVEASLDPKFPPLAGYSFFSGKMPMIPQGVMWFDVVAEADGKKTELRDREFMVL